MRELVAGLFISLDGVVESPGRFAYEYLTDEMRAYMGAGVGDSDSILIGRATYDEFAELWPGATGPMADFLNDTPKYVVTSREDELTWKNSRRLSGDLKTAVLALKAEQGKAIRVPGSPTLVRTLIRLGLLDTLGLFVFPTVVGGGERLYDGLTGDTLLRAVDSHTFSNGVLSVTYRAN